MLLKLRSSAVAAMAALILAPFAGTLLPVSVAGASPTTVLVDATGQSGWNTSQTCYDSNYDAVVPTYPSDQVTFVAGPSAPPLGVGSLQLATGNGTVGGTCVAALRNNNYNGVLLSSLTSLSYSTYESVNNTQQFPFIVLHINYGIGDPNADDSLFFEPPYQTPGTGNSACTDQGVTVNDSWQTWNALTGCWWSNSGNFGNQGTGVEPLSDLLAQYPNAFIQNETDPNSLTPGVAQGGVSVEVGEGQDTDQFVGNVDNFTIGTATSTTTYNFDPTPLNPTITWPTPASISYGTPLGYTQLDAAASYGSSTVAGTYSYTPSLGTVLSVGPHTLSVTFTPSSAVYAAVNDSVSITVTPASTSSSSSVIYDSTTSPQPPNLPSVGFEANQVAEFGNQVTFTPGSPRALSQATVTMSSWACQSGSWTNVCTTSPGATFTEPITLNIYNVGANNTVGTLIKSVTQTFTIPYRPSSDPTDCPSSGEWFSSATGECYNGLATNVTFTLPDVLVPSSIIYGVAYNTSDYGAAPYGDNTSCDSPGPDSCAYDSLNIGLTEGTQPSVGSDPLPGTVYWNTASGANYCDLGAAGAGTFRLDSPSTAPCWGVSPPYSSAPWYIPAVQFVATQITPTITWANPAPISYGTKLSATQLDASATYGSVSVAGTFSYTPTLGTAPSAGGHTLSVTFTPSSSNFSSVTTSVPITVTPAVLTVTATNASRAFGAANPTFTYTVSGFQNGDTSSVDHGSPSCTTTAAATSASGTYPITCTVGTLTTSTNYTFSFKPGVLTVGSGCLSGTFNGYSVPNGASVCFGSGATINAYLNVGVGSSLDIEGAKVNGPITSVHSNVVRVCGATISGPVTLSFDTGAVDIGDGGGCSASKISSALTLTSDSGGSEVVGATVSGPLTLSGDSGGETLNANTVTSALTVQFSSGGVTANRNTVSGPFTLESNAGGVTADSNNSTQSFTIQSNSGGVTILSNSTKANFTVESNYGTNTVSGNTAKGFTYIH
jgi:hypothetical protein